MLYLSILLNIILYINFIDGFQLNLLLKNNNFKY